MKCYRDNFRAMGSPCQVRVFAETRQHAQRGFDAVKATVARLEAKYSRYRADTLTSRINAAAGSAQWIPLDSETYRLCEMAGHAFRLSDGLFDLTAGVLRKAWDFRSGRLPSQRDLDALLPLVGWEQIEWQAFSVPHAGSSSSSSSSLEPSSEEMFTYDQKLAESPSGWSIRLPRLSMELDFGGIVKEYAADAAATALMAQGLQHGLVDLGGDLSVAGPHPDGTGWRVAVRNPRFTDVPVSAISVSCGGVATSGDYERFIEHNGRRYCHILDARTGWPVSGLASVTVVSELSVVSGIASTVALLKGESAGLAWLRSLNVPFLAVTENGCVVTEQTPSVHPVAAKY